MISHRSYECIPTCYFTMTKKMYQVNIYPYKLLEEGGISGSDFIYGYNL
jgi:hypothetical protein